MSTSRWWCVVFMTATKHEQRGMIDKEGDAIVGNFSSKEFTTLLMHDSGCVVVVMVASVAIFWCSHDEYGVMKHRERSGVRMQFVDSFLIPLISILFLISLRYFDYSLFIFWLLRDLFIVEYGSCVLLKCYGFVVVVMKYDWKCGDMKDIDVAGWFLVVSNCCLLGKWRWLCLC